MTLFPVVEEGAPGLQIQPVNGWEQAYRPKTPRWLLQERDQELRHLVRPFSFVFYDHEKNSQGLKAPVRDKGKMPDVETIGGRCRGLAKLPCCLAKLLSCNLRQCRHLQIGRPSENTIAIPQPAFMPLDTPNTLPKLTLGF